MSVPARQSRARAVLRAGLVAVALAAAGTAGYGVLFDSSADDGAAGSYRFGTVSRADLVSSVSATGTLSPVVVVEVGTQVSGQIKELLADYNSVVRRDQVVARLDPDSYEAKVRQAEGDLAVANADVSIKRAAMERARAEIENARAEHAAARADIDRYRAAMEDAARDRDRKSGLMQKGVIAASVVERADAVLQQARAQLAAATAQEVAAAASVRSRGAQLRMAEADQELADANVRQKAAILSVQKVDLERTIIRSPIDGIVIDRSVSVGQTVSASLETPVLFTIAQDLRHMLVSVSVDEADIGKIKDGQAATFTVDAFREQEFAGSVQQIQKAPLMVQNVVTYTVVVRTDNPDQRLLPGMTAGVRILTETRGGVLRVPDAALRFRPLGAEEARPTPAGRGGERRGTVWVLGDDGRPKAVAVTVGASDGTLSEVAKGDLAEGQEVIVGIAEPDRRVAARRLPF